MSNDDDAAICNSQYFSKNFNYWLTFLRHLRTAQDDTVMDYKTVLRARTFTYPSLLYWPPAATTSISTPPC